VLSCACKTDASNEPRQTITTIRFMGRKAGTLNRVIQNQDWDVNLQLVFGDILTCHTLHAFKSRNAVLRPRSPWQLRSTRRTFKAIPYRSSADDQLKFRRDRESISAPFLIRRFRGQDHKQPGNVSRNRD